MLRGIILRQFSLICLIIISTLQLVVAQNGTNPFELQHRIPKEELQQDSVQITTDNPFEIKSRQKPDSTEKSASIPNEPTEIETVNPFDIQKVKSPKLPEELKTKNQDVVITIVETDSETDTRSGFLFWMILSVMVFLALLVTLYRSLIGKIYRAFSNENILKLLQREQAGSFPLPYLFLYLLFFVSAGIFAFQIAYYNKAISFEFKNLVFSIFGVFLFFLIKHLILKILEWTFPIAKEVKQYSFTVVIFSIMLGIILMPFNIFIAFAQDSLTKTGIIAALVAVTAVYLFRALRGLFIVSKFLVFHKFHFFMYLCAVEIAPLIIVVKLLLNGANNH